MWVLTHPQGGKCELLTGAVLCMDGDEWMVHATVPPSVHIPTSSRILLDFGVHFARCAWVPLVVFHGRVILKELLRMIHVS